MPLIGLFLAGILNGVLVSLLLLPDTEEPLEYPPPD
jgi:hypothetical protein